MILSVVTVIPLIMPVIIIITLTLIFTPSLPILILFSGYVLVFVIVVSIPLSKMLKAYRCFGEEEHEINGVKLTICKEGPVNAWYDASKNRIYIGDKLLNVLNRDELIAVYYHELGHKSSRLLRFIVAATVTFWLWVTATIIFVLVLHYIGLVDFVSILAYIFSSTLLSTIATMINMWINEHEADMHSINNTNARNLISALAKIYVLAQVYRNQHLKEAVEIEIKNVDIDRLINAAKSLRLRDVVKIILLEGLRVVAGVMKIFNLVIDPLPPTHPPLELRILKISDDSLFCKV